MVVVLSIHRESPCGFNDSNQGQVFLHLLCSQGRRIGRVIDHKRMVMECGIGEVPIRGYLFLGDTKSR